MKPEFMNRRSSGAAILAAVTVLSSPCSAGMSDVPDSLRQQAIEACTSDALRLCTEALPNEQDTIACMAGNRLRLEPPCRRLYDRVVRLLRR